MKWKLVQTAEWDDLVRRVDRLDDHTTMCVPLPFGVHQVAPVDDVLWALLAHLRLGLRTRYMPGRSAGVAVSFDETP